MSFLNSLVDVHNETVTTNGAVAFKSSLNANLDLFGLAGAMRSKPQEAVRLFRLAFAENELLAIRCMFYLRDVRGGQGERNLFREMFKELYINLDNEMAKRLLVHIPKYGRWDDLFDIALMDDCVSLVSEQLDLDIKNLESNKPVSLLAKWMPSENASSDKTRKLAQALAKSLGFSPRKYRKTLSALRKQIVLLEQNMSTKNWDKIDYSKVPSVAFKKHTKAFKRNDEVKFNSFLAAVEKGEQKVNASTLYTYEIYEMVAQGREKEANALWINLPDFAGDKNALVVADVSGSMTGRPMSVSVSLALYFAERNKGAFKNYFMTFSSKSELVKVTGKTLGQKMNNIQSADWEQNTNLMSAFNSILKAALDAKAPQSEMPSTLYIVSDMQFDHCVTNNSPFREAKAKFESHGYQLPHVVFWNVNASNTQVPATSKDGNVTLISGLSQNTFRYAVEGKSPIELMEEVLNSERYSTILI